MVKNIKTLTPNDIKVQDFVMFNGMKLKVIEHKDINFFKTDYKNASHDFVEEFVMEYIPSQEKWFLY